ncbi:Serine/threonine-protein kinase/endoribonuclease IRE2 [Lamellibrachia satsuma]|nr:Serine/threonine-protein kinase/endoribonuclease IRE2 [Lamellibrachia satsuma]
MTDGREVAVKEVLKRGNRWKESMQEEVDILVKLRPHANIVSYKLTEWPEGRFGYIVTELCEFSLNEWLEDDQVKRKSDEEWDREVPGLMTDLLSGLNHLHTHDPMFLHRDIKPQNVLVVFHNKKACLKLADFGISRSLADGQTAAFTNVAGTQTWQAAELIRQGTGIFDYRRSTDIQVCGMVAYYIKSRGKHPFAARTPHDIETKILANETDLSALNEPLVEDLVVSMLKPEPTDRPSAATLLRHPYFWTEEKRYKFLTAVGNEPEIVDSHVPENKGNAVRQAIECAKTDILPNKTDWCRFLAWYKGLQLHQAFDGHHVPNRQSLLAGFNLC